MIDPLSYPLISIITVVKNGASYLESTIQNILTQDYKNIEFIIIDGASTDGTIDVIKKYESKLTYWISEPDLGIADAWNKGIDVSTGQVIGILNAGDYLSDKFYLSAIANAFKPGQSTVFYGNTHILSESGQIIKRVVGSFDPGGLLNGIGFLHPGCFATRKAYDLVGKFSLRYRLAMDCDWLFRCYRANISFEKLEILCIMIDGGASNQSNLAAYGEYLQAMKDNDFPLEKIYLSMGYVALRGLTKSVISYFRRA